MQYTNIHLCFWGCHILQHSKKSNLLKLLFMPQATVYWYQWQDPNISNVTGVLKKKKEEEKKKKLLADRGGNH